MGTAPPSSSTTLYDYSADLSGGYPGGLALMRRGTTCRTSYSAADTSNPASNNKWNVHAWATNPFTSAFNLKGRVTLSIFTTTVGGVSGRGFLCATLIDRQIFSGLPSDRVLGTATYDVSNWPSDVRRLTFTFNLSQQETIASGHRLVLALNVRSESARTWRFLYDHSTYPSLLEVETTTPLLMSRLRRMLAADQRGIALPLALAVLFVVAGLAAVAARAAIHANHQSLRDSTSSARSRRPMPGINAAIYQLNLMQPTRNECVVTRAPPAAPWRPSAAPSERLVPSSDRGSGRQRQLHLPGLTVDADSPSTERPGRDASGRIVSTGTVNGVLRRVSMRVTAPAGDPLFPKGFAVVSLNSVSYGNSVTITGNLGSNGNITLANTAKVTGNAVPGIGKTVTLNNSATVSGAKTAATEPFALLRSTSAGPDPQRQRAHRHHRSLDQPGRHQLEPHDAGAVDEPARPRSP